MRKADWWDPQHTKQLPALALLAVAHSCAKVPSQVCGGVGTWYCSWFTCCGEASTNMYAMDMFVLS